MKEESYFFQRCNTTKPKTKVKKLKEARRIVERLLNSGIIAKDLTEKSKITIQYQLKLNF